MSTINTNTNNTGVAASALTSLTSTSSADSATSTDKKGSLGKDDFLQLLVTQLNNQNPLSPQDNSEFVAQLAQFSSVESLQNLNTSVNGIASNYQSSQALQASSLVGRSVIAQTGSSMVDTSKSFNGTLIMPAAGTNVSVSVYDTAGSLVKTIDLGSAQAGKSDFIWDGTDDKGNKLNAGVYSFKATAAIDETKQALTTYLPATVNSVTLGQDGGEMQLNLAGLGSVTLSQVQMIGQ
ncbi:flagellar hook assembly protein FlgD [Pseudomonas asuensis]|jgi:flagellar basal-body rod modification protein FlgD|uniref:Basal-body rod modification protein FlgD n=1 Tax=Pseudomonas asuensis TaxID=1825787 RepID=A0ABQ2H1I0_9PSED|nr:flagellar hook assembly protein FlgD [Pseudomonas asuensis]GGM26577.1 basal-body rod modification protein FlgD [Pseudomonas asuensis]